MLSDTTLTLTGVSSQTGWFSDRPYRLASQISTEGLTLQWDEEEGFYAKDPPNADFTRETDGQVVSYVVELTSPSMVADDLSYSVNGVGDTVLPQTPIACEADSHLFIDSEETACVWLPSGKRGPLCGCTNDAQCELGNCQKLCDWGIGRVITEGTGYDRVQFCMPETCVKDPLGGDLCVPR